MFKCQVGRTLMSLICKALIELGTVVAIEMRIVLLLTFLAIGRAGEAGIASWNATKWVFEEGGYLYMDWSEKKVGAQKPMSFFCDASSYELCLWHSFACYFVVGGGQHAVSSIDASSACWIFPFLAKLASPAAQLNRYLKFVYDQGKVEGLSPDTTGTGFRIGATNWLSLNPLVTLSMIISRGGWDMKGICNVFEYLLVQQAAINIAGRALSGWQNPRKSVISPRLVFLDTLNSQEKKKFDNFMNRLLSLHWNPRFDAKGDLRPFAKACFASLLMYLPELNRDAPNGEVMSTIRRYAAEFNYPMSTIRNWGTDIRAAFVSDNITASTDGLGDKAGVIIDGQNAMRAELSSLNEKCIILTAEVKELKQLVLSLQDLTVGSTGSALIRRSKTTATPARVSPDAGLMFLPEPLPPYQFKLKNFPAREMLVTWKLEKLHDMNRWATGNSNRYDGNKSRRVVKEMIKLAINDVFKAGEMTTELEVLNASVPSIDSDDRGKYECNLRALSGILQERLMAKLKEEELKVEIVKERDNAIRPYVSAIAGRITCVNSMAEKLGKPKYFSKEE